MAFGADAFSSLRSSDGAAQKAAKKERQKKYMTVFINGKLVKVKRPELIDGMDKDDYIGRNADPIWLHQNEMWEYMESDDSECE